MTVPTTPGPITPRHLRIAITSPDILARIRHVFAAKNLAMEITGLPYVEVTVWPAAEAVPADPPAVGSAARRLNGPTGGAGADSTRACAEYRLHVVEVGDRSTAEPAAPVRRRHLAAVPDYPADDPAPDLSPRQREVMAMVSRGARNAEIAAALRISEKTVKNHINRIFRLLGAGNRVEAVLAWQRRRPDEASRREPAPVPAPDHPGREGTG